MHRLRFGRLIGLFYRSDEAGIYLYKSIKLMKLAYLNVFPILYAVRKAILKNRPIKSDNQEMLVNVPGIHNFSILSGKPQ